MTPDPESHNDPRFPNAGEILARTRWLWRLCLLLPFIYLGLAALIERFWFDPRHLPGFWPMRGEAYCRILTILGILAVAAQIIHLIIRFFFGRRIQEVRLIPAVAANLCHRRTLWMAATSDFVCGLGLVAFLINADWHALVFFCGFSYLLYIQSYPRGNRIKP